jgi:NAD(P) transhydrogenase
MGIQFHWGERVEACTAGDSPKVRLRCSSGREFSLDGVLVAAGRTSNTQDLNLPAAGITPAARGLLTVDNCFRTSVPHIFAVGDVIGFPALAATSAEQGRAAAFHACGRPAFAVANPVLPTGIYTIPEVSMVGETEESLRTQGVEYFVGRAFARDNARGKMKGDSDGFLKLIFRRGDRRLLGAQAFGEDACETIHIALIVMVAGQGAQLLFETCFNYPTLGELYKIATIDALASDGTADGAPPIR